jgi:hypothetical protein
VKAADQALYTAKVRGRNRSVPFDRQLSGMLTRSGRIMSSAHLRCVTVLRRRRLSDVAIWEHVRSGNQKYDTSYGRIGYFL